MLTFKFKAAKGLTYTAVLLCSLWLTACGGSSGDNLEVNTGGSANGDGSSNTPTAEGIHGRVSIGPVYDANVSLYKADTINFNKKLSEQADLLLDTTTTDNTSGAFSGLDSGNYNGPLLLVVSVDEDSSYYDVAGAASGSAAGTVSFSNVDLDTLLPANSFFPDSKAKRHLLFSLLPKPVLDEGVGVTTLTTMATLLASINHPSGMNVAQILDYNRAVTKTFFRWLPDGINLMPTAFDANTSAHSLDYSFDNDYTKHDMYALVLAVLADMGTGNSPALKAHQALLADIKSTKIDSLNGDYAHFFEVYEQWQTSLTKYTDAYATNDLKAKLTSNSYILPYHQVLTCDGVANGDHDGICAKIDGQYRNALTSNYTGRFHLENESRLDIKYVDITPESTTQWILELPVDITGPVTTSCDGDHKIKLQGDPVQASDESLYDCQITYEQVGRVVSGHFTAKVKNVTSGEVFDITEGRFRVTLPKSDDFIKGTFDGDSLEPTPSDVFVHIYQPEKYIHLISTDIDTFANWEVIITDLSKAKNGNTVTNTNCKPADKGLNSYVAAKNSTGIGHTNREDNHDCEIKFSINNGVLEGTFEMTDVKIVTDFDPSLNPIFHYGDANGSFKVYLPDGPVGYPSASFFK